jgi:hypothetical protein
MRAAFGAIGLVAALAALPCAAVDDHFDPSKYEKGGFAPATDEIYAKECGSCHFSYLPGMLPERSWHALMARASEHFGESLGLAPEVARHIEDYLAANAADRSPYDGARIMLSQLPDDRTPTRITPLPHMRHRHVVVNKLMSSPVYGTKVKTLTNCDACHEKAATGSFAYDQIVVPGVSKIVRPGGMF